MAGPCTTQKLKYIKEYGKEDRREPENVLELPIRSDLRKVGADLEIADGRGA